MVETPTAAPRRASRRPSSCVPPWAASAAWTARTPGRIGLVALLAVAALALPSAATEIAMRGGTLHVRRDGGGALHLSGEARHHGRVEIGLDAPIEARTLDS